MNEQVRKVLTRARELIAAPKSWIKGAVAQTSDGDVVTPWFKEACRFCALGAVTRAAAEVGSGIQVRLHDEIELAARAALMDALEARAGRVLAGADRRIDKFNDAAGTEHEHVLALFDEALT